MDNFKIKLDKAKNLHKTKEFEKAVNLYNELILEKPDYFETYYYLGNLKIALKDFQKAEKYFREAINHKPDFFQSYMNLGNTLKELSKFYEPNQEILPEKGTIVIIPASRSHSATYNGKLDRIMIGINFYSI